MRLRVDDLWFSYQGQSHATLAEVNLQIATPTSCAVTGPSGCGKSTLLALIAGHLTPDRGAIEIDGKRIGRRVQAELARSGAVAWVLQDAARLAQRSVLDNVTLPAVLAGVARDSAEEEAIGLLEGFGISETAHRPAATLSGGQAQRMAMARALICHPRVLLADEPTANLDVTTARDVSEKLIAVGQAHTVVLIATHDPYIAGLCERRLDLEPPARTGHGMA
ncbi:MAG: ATP-binding cassette domain-containing protein [Arachnia sp.]